MRNPWGLNPISNDLTAGSVEPSDGASIAALATGPGRVAVASGPNKSPVATQDVGVTMGQGSPIMGFAVFAVLIVIAWWAAHEVGNEGEFSNLKASFFNVTMVTLIAIAGIPVAKVAFVKLEDMGVPFADHLAAWSLAA